MEEQERIEGESEDVEGHRRKAKLMASEESTGEDELESDDVEAHRRKAQLMASEESTGEEEEESDVEAHALRHRPQAL